MTIASAAFVDPSFHDRTVIQEYMATNWGAAFPESTFKGQIGRLERQVIKWRMGFEVQGQHSGSNAFNIASLGYNLEPLSTPIYSFVANYSVRDDDVAMAEYRGFSEAAIQESLAKRAQFMALRDAMFFGIKPNSNEGLLNCDDRTTAALLTSDALGETLLLEQDNGEVGYAMIGHFNNLLKRAGLISASGLGIGIIAPQDFWGKVMGTPIELTSAQRKGAGSMSIWDFMVEWAERKGIKLTHAYDEKLKGKGTNGTEPVIIFLHEVPQAQNEGEFSLNGDVAQPADNAVISQYYMMPIQNTMPQNDGGFHVHLKSRMTPGVAWRGTAVTVLSYVVA